MKPIEFKECNHIYEQEKDDNVGVDLPVCKVKDSDGHIIICYQLSFLERIKLLFTGKIWGCFKTFYMPLPPSYYTVNKKELINPKLMDKLSKDAGQL